VLHYSGKKKTHSDKNLMIATVKTKRVAFLSRTYPGKTQDKKVADTENIVYPKKMVLHEDSGFQGCEPKVCKLHQPKKRTARCPRYVFESNKRFQGSSVPEGSKMFCGTRRTVFRIWS